MAESAADRRAPGGEQTDGHGDQHPASVAGRRGEGHTTASRWGKNKQTLYKSVNRQIELHNIAIQY